jgi:hypothetical protein
MELLRARPGLRTTGNREGDGIADAGDGRAIEAP